MSSLVLIDSQFRGSTSVEHKITGMDGTYDHYAVLVKGVGVGNNNGINIRVTKSGTVQTGSNFSFAGSNIQGSGSHTIRTGTASSTVQLFNNVSSNNPQNFGIPNFWVYCYDFPSTNYDTMIAYGVSDTNTYGDIWNMPINASRHKVASASDGIAITQNSGSNLYISQIQLYGLT
jgi:hypothetical protein